MGKRLDFLFFWDAARRDVFESISSLSGYFSTLSLNPPKKIIKEKTETSLFWWAFCIFVQEIFLWSSCEVLLSRSSYQLPKDWSIKLKKKLNERRKFSVRLSLMNDLAWTTNMFFSSLASYYYKRIIAKMQLSRSLFFQVVSLSCCIVFRILCSFLAIFL